MTLAPNNNPTNVNSRTMMSLVWNKIADGSNKSGGLPISRYQVFEDTKILETTPKTQMAMVVTQRTCFNYYNFYVRATNKCGDSKLSKK